MKRGNDLKDAKAAADLFYKINDICFDEKYGVITLALAMILADLILTVPDDEFELERLHEFVEVVENMVQRGRKKRKS